ncbi:sensor histidine kinase [Roseinatronobacter alkalisoli]|uniref:ATP-binding protein n=1 Tax=Roseinatronobacter alkalisoli TaxID=3028235 RepID=A0ABT5TCU1_9RHOB|nr:ATP-binding protein [Roseinatronobacter sp. HJB301]MDD7971957.1 ATP-binding protein [Roseinatronobacter sp. HJB301]
MKIRIPPVIQIYILGTISLLLAVLSLGIALDQAYLGLRLTPEARSTAPARIDGMRIDAVFPGSPVAGLPGTGIPTLLSSLAALADSDGKVLSITPEDLIEEPDAMDSYATMDAFFARQDEISKMLRNDAVTLEVQFLDESRFFTIQPARQRPIRSLPFAFWLQITVGLGGVWIGVWIWALRRGDWATRCLAFSGAGLMVSAFPAAIYSTRELALPADLFRALSSLNHLGAFAFGVGMIGLFMVYPRRLFQPRWLVFPALVLGTWFVLAHLGMMESPVIGIHMGVILALLAIVILVGLQFRATRGDPRDRAALSWLGLAVLVGSGAFVITVIAPHLLGIDAFLSQGVAFVFFLLVYVGVALGVARFQLFQLENWAFRILFYVVGVVLLLSIDALLILTIVDERVPAFALSLLIVALVWLPLRDTLARLILRRREPARADRFRKIMDVALTPPERDQQNRWQVLLADMFNPLSLVHGVDAGAPHLREDGLILALPRVHTLPPLELRFADGGRRLFSARDLELATEMTAMLAQALESRAAYEKGVSEERTRIARDIHDNIGVQLMAALHSPERTRKDIMIRETLTDLRDIINNASNPDMSFDEMLADLRAQIAEQLFIAGVTMKWWAENAQALALPLQSAHMLRSIIREAVQNALKHASPGRMDISVRFTRGRILVSVSDDGNGFEPARVQHGNGLANLRDRIDAVRGVVRIESSPKGTRITAEIPLSKSMKEDT